MGRRPDETTVGHLTRTATVRLPEEKTPDTERMRPPSRRRHELQEDASQGAFAPLARVMPAARVRHCDLGNQRGATDQILRFRPAKISLINSRFSLGDDSAAAPKHHELNPKHHSENSIPVSPLPFGVVC